MVNNGPTYMDNVTKILFPFDDQNILVYPRMTAYLKKKSCFSTILRN